MLAMLAKRYRLLDYAAWRLVKWYVRRRLPSARTLAGGLAAGVGLTAVAVVIAKRAAG
jgi:hypothetical protein